MARLQLTIPKQGSWSDDDVLVLLIGTENAASLAASTPAGGTAYGQTFKVGDSLDDDGDDVVIEFEYTPADKCATLPIGVASQDEYGNRSSTWEYQSILQLQDPPLGVDRPTATATANPNEALIEWNTSADIET